MEYFHTYKTNIKERWKNRPLLEVLVSEFTTRTEEYYIEAIKEGVITLNGKRTTIHRKLLLTDVMEHTVHIHEPCPYKIHVISEEKDYIVVNKPAGIPCHPTGGYINYSVTKFVLNDKKCGCINRLDMPVSGVLIIAFNNFTQCFEKMKSAQKIYVAKVKGMFPDELTIDKRIKNEGDKKRFVSDDGKECLTICKRLEYRDGYSLVECRPITGRTHQIRIHLKSVGFPIVNDIAYGEGEDDIVNESVDPCNADISMFEDKKKYECIVKYCKGINNRSFNNKNYYICLHAYKYIYDDKEFTAPIPKWYYE